MDYLLFAVEEAAKESEPLFEHGFAAAVVYTFLLSLTVAFYAGALGYEEARSSPRINTPNLVRFNFNVVDMVETEESRKDAKGLAIATGIALCILTNIVVFFPAYFFFDLAYNLFCLDDLFSGR